MADKKPKPPSLPETMAKLRAEYEAPYEDYGSANINELPFYDASTPRRIYGQKFVVEGQTWIRLAGGASIRLAEEKEKAHGTAKPAPRKPPRPGSDL